MLACASAFDSCNWQRWTKDLFAIAGGLSSVDGIPRPTLGVL